MNSRRPAEELEPEIDRLREDARERVARMSLSYVANEVEMSPETLRVFLSGGAIAFKRRTRLARWLDETRRVADERAARCVEMVLEVVSDLEERRRMKAVSAVLTALREQYKQGVGAAPLWLLTLIESLDAGCA
jgi:hypothetical protein